MELQQLQELFTNVNDFSKSTKTNLDAKQYIIDNTSFLSADAKFAQRLWHLVNQQLEMPSCKVCNRAVRWNPTKKSYSTYCSCQCAALDPSKVAKSIAWKSDPDKVSKATQVGLINRQATNLERYGHTNYLASVDGLEMNKVNNTARSDPTSIAKRTTTRKATFTRAYGVDNPALRVHSPDTLAKLQSVEWMNRRHVVEQSTLTSIALELGIAGGAVTVGRHLHNHGIKTHSFSRSMGERSVGEYVQSLGVECVFNDRSIIKPRELDIYIPSHNLAIEYCGVYWHSEQQGKGRQYHKSKMDQCNAHGIQLITMFEDEWFTRTEQVKRKLASLLNASSENAVFARKCQIVNVSTGDRVKFLDANHIQGDGSGSITHGLMHSGQLVAVMVWKRTSDRVWLLNRYATACKVPGGFSRLLEHFKQAVEWDQLVSFADLRWSDGSLYANTGWVHSSTIPPDYSYSPDGIERYHKFNYRRKNLPNLLEFFDPSLSEWENCRANEVLRLWDCGKMRFTITA